jgi:hypothetical protein
MGAVNVPKEDMKIQEERPFMEDDEVYDAKRDL